MEPAESAGSISTLFRMTILPSGRTILQSSGLSSEEGGLPGMILRSYHLR